MSENSYNGNYDSRAIGKQAENRACLFLKKQGYKILRRNWHLRFGEIDILTKNRAGDVCIIEVKYQSSSIARAKEQVDFKKQRQLRKLYLAVAKCYPENNIRVHILAMDNQTVELFEDAIIDE